MRTDTSSTELDTRKAISHSKDVQDGISPGVQLNGAYSHRTDYKLIKQNYNKSKKILVLTCQGKTGVSKENLLEQKENQQTQPMVFKWYIPTYILD